jgi:hypothetical protein
VKTTTLYLRTKPNRFGVIRGTVASESRKGKTHHLGVYVTSGALICECEAFAFRKHHDALCKHLRAWQDRLHLERESYLRSSRPAA